MSDAVSVPYGIRASPSPLALGVILSAQLMVVLDFSIVNVALPSIQRELGFSPSSEQWVVTAYAIAFGGLLILGGRAGDVLGPRRIFLGGLIAFSIASLVGGFASSGGMLLAARAAQGVGAALIAPTALLCSRPPSPRDRRGTGRSACTARRRPSDSSPDSSWAGRSSPASGGAPCCG